MDGFLIFCFFIYSVTYLISGIITYHCLFFAGFSIDIHSFLI